jgi:SAM-dependent methyltransferase
MPEAPARAEIEEEPGEPHWTEVYRTSASQIYETEAAIFQNAELTRRELELVDAIAGKLGGAVESPILDLACGTGRHCFELARRGHSVQGLDFSEGLLAIARGGDGRPAASAPGFVCADMRSQPFRDGAFRTVLLLGNSFGFFSDEDNARVLRQAYRSLAEGGLLILEITDKATYLSPLRTHEVEVVERDGREPLRSEWWRSWDAEARRIRIFEGHTEAVSGRVVYEGDYDIRLYDPDEVEELLAAAGFAAVTAVSASISQDQVESDLCETFGLLGEAILFGARK